MSGKPVFAEQRSFQRTLFPLELTEVLNSDQGTADLKVIGRATNGKHYAIKSVSDTEKGKVPACELFCYEIAAQLDIATPDYQLIAMRDSTLAFGSAWEGGVILLKEDADFLDVLLGPKKPKDIVEMLSRIYALDIFINNIDRHFHNYLFRNSFKSNIILALDFSRAWYEVDPYGFHASEDPDNNTSLSHQIIKKIGCFDKDTAIDTLERIKKIPKDTIRQIFSLMPSAWIDIKESSEIIEWWSSEHFLERIKRLKGVI